MAPPPSSSRSLCRLLALELALAVTCAASGVVSAQTFTRLSIPALDSVVTFETGASWVDYDGDGDLDLFVVTGFAADNDNLLFQNDGTGSFTRIRNTPVAMDGAESVCSTWADFDNDGNPDCFVSNLVDQGGALYRGHSGGTLTLEGAAGIGGPDLLGTGCAWGDYDNDGFVDLVVAALFGQGNITTPNHLFHNLGDGTFATVTSGPEVTTLDTHHYPTWSDFDGDGDLDLFFATGSVGAVHLDRMYRNELVETGTPTFAPLTSETFATESRDSQSLLWVDYDNDGDLDLFAVNYSTVPNQLYRNDGGGTFTKITTGAIVTDRFSCHGAAWGDFDNDGALDLYVATDLGQANLYYRNNGDGTFTRVTTGDFVTARFSNYGVVAGDMDHDGDLDLFVPTARSEAPGLLYRNNLANGNHWLDVQCVGTQSNRAAIGAKVRVRATLGGTPRWQMREIQAGTGYGGQGPLAAHFGLGAASQADSLVVEWPSGARSVRTSVPAGPLVEVVEDAATPVLADLLTMDCGPDSVALLWQLGATDAQTVTIERRQESEPWTPLATRAPDALRRVRFVDTRVVPGARYGYRLRWAGAPDRFAGETWVSVPRAPALRLELAVPQAVGRDLRLRLSLATPRPVTIALFDATGRRVGGMHRLALAAGVHDVSLPLPRELTPGLYFLHAVGGDETRVARAILVR